MIGADPGSSGASAGTGAFQMLVGEKRREPGSAAGGSGSGTGSGSGSGVGFSSGPGTGWPSGFPGWCAASPPGGAAFDSSAPGCGPAAGGAFAVVLPARQ